MSRPAVRFGISAYDYPPEDVLEMARTAEDVGFDMFWFGEHYAVPATHSSTHPATSAEEERAILAPTTRLYDPWFLLGAVASATRRLRLGTGICIVPLNNPLMLARSTITAHDFSGGRFMLGTGAGWLREEYEALGVPFEERGTRLDETIEILRKAWRGGFFDHEGKHFRFASLQIMPHAVNVPLICGGNAGKALRRVASTADGWINSAMIALPEAQRLRDEIEALRATYGTSGKRFSYFVRPPSVTPEEIDSFVRAGFEDIVLWGPNLWPRDTTISLEQKRRGLERIADNLGIRPASHAVAAGAN